ncbi:MAG TPA: tetratricopeptide repeat protein [Brumimicrobium sp.]|nr:tetratricopeptide repeat protein [Brumimicrobium sp.]
MTKLLCTIGFITLAFVSFGQKSIIDSLLRVESSLEIRKDTSHIKLLYELSSRYESIDLDSALLYGEKALSYSEKIKYKKGIAESNLAIGNYYNAIGKYEQSLQHFMNAKVIYESTNDRFNISRTLNLIGNCLLGYEKIEKALETYLEGLKIVEELGDEYRIAVLAIGVGNCYLQLEDNNKAIKYFSMSKRLFSKLNSEFYVAFSQASIANAQASLGLYEASFENYNLALDVFKQSDNQYSVAITYQGLADAYKKSKNYDQAITYYYKAREIFIDRNAYYNLKEISKELAHSYASIGKFENAYKYHQDFSIYNDSVFNEQVNEQILEIEGKYETDKKQNEIEIQNLQLSEKDAKIAEATLRSNTLYGFVGVSLFISIVLLFGIQINRKNNSKLNAINQDLGHKNTIIEQKSKEITDSISYAKRIQNAIMPTADKFSKALPNSFVLYMPKDIISGDFYWLVEKTDSVLFAAADCTGHGVPGAMVSVVCNNGLNRSVQEKGMTNPGRILDKTRELVVEQFQKSTEDVKDGMDIAICELNFKKENFTIDNQSAVLNYAGANNPVFIVRRQDHDEPILMEIKATKQPIGKVDKPKSFMTHEVALLKGDTVYIFTDGYVDQFGGSKGKKLMYKPFRELLLSINNESMQSQKNLLTKYFNNWKGNLEQVDDVCVIGVRV